MEYVVLSDLHLGNVRSDLESLEVLIKKVKDVVLGVRKLVVVGDLIDSTNLYELQKYLHLPKTMKIQKFLVRWFTDLVKEYVNPDEMIYVKGNHEDNVEGIDVDELLEGSGFKVYDLYYCEHYLDFLSMNSRKICFIHADQRNVRGSKVVSITPLKRIGEYVISDQLDCDVLVTGHIHKILSIQKYGSRTFITLPSFMLSKSVYEDVTFTPCIVVVESMERFTTLCRERKINDLKNFEMRNLVKTSGIIRNYMK